MGAEGAKNMKEKRDKYILHAVLQENRFPVGFNLQYKPETRMFVVKHDCGHLVTFYEHDMLPSPSNLFIFLLMSDYR
jgi:hypothetical protein